MQPDKWPVPQQGQVLTVQRRCRRGWLSGFFWPSGDGFHFVFQGIDGSYCMHDASDKPLEENWITTLGKSTFMMSQGATAHLVTTDDSFLDQLEGWRVEIEAGRPRTTRGPKWQS
jgi:hypothetical protein